MHPPMAHISPMARAPSLPPLGGAQGQLPLLPLLQGLSGLTNWQLPLLIGSEFSTRIPSYCMNTG